jgi:hypothetical protein
MMTPPMTRLFDAMDGLIYIPGQPGINLSGDQIVNIENKLTVICKKCAEGSILPITRSQDSRAE